MFEALARLILDASGRAPLAIILEDLQSADEMSLRFLSFLAHRIEARPILLAVTAREDETDDVPLLGRMLRELDREGRVSDHPGLACPQEFAGFGRRTGHQGGSVVVAHVDLHWR